MQRVKIWKLFGLPSPKDLGWSKTNSLPSKMFSSDDETPTWEDWEEKMRKEYPVRYFLAETVPSFFQAKIKSPLKQAKYWFVSHFIPSRRYHMLDLRQPKKDKHAYRWGWIDSDTQIMYALFNILNNFVEHEMPNFRCPSEEEIQQEPFLMSQRNAWFEIKAIHYWWNVERKRTEEILSKASKNWHDVHLLDHEKGDKLWDDYKVMQKAFDDKTEEMIMRLMKVRHSLWT